MKTVCVYHSRDLDGWMSAAIVKKWFIKENKQTIEDSESGRLLSNNKTKTIDFLGWDYGDNIPDLSEYDKVIMCDISFPMEEMYDVLVNRIGDNLVWIDHHISAIKNFEIWNKSYGSHHLEGLREIQYAACELTWKYFFPNETMPEIVRLLGMYDSHRKTGVKGVYVWDKVLEFQYGARAVIFNYKDAYNMLKRSIQYQKFNKSTVDGMLKFTSPENDIFIEGEHIYKYLCDEAKETYKKAFPIQFDIPGYKERKGIGGAVVNKDKYTFLCVNAQRFNPDNFGIDYHKYEYDGFACFWYDKGKWTFSLYNDNEEVDCSEIAEQYGGGGHKGAAGFVISNLEEIICKYE